MMGLDASPPVSRILSCWTALDELPVSGRGEGDRQNKRHDGNGTVAVFLPFLLILMTFRCCYCGRVCSGAANNTIRC
jgi:hypothetical protein